MWFAICFQTKVLEYRLPLPEFIPNHKLSYSDHEAVLAKILVADSDEPAIVEQTCRKESKINMFDSKKTLQECINICDESMNRLRSHKRFYLLMAITSFVILVYTLDFYPSFGWKSMYLIFKVILSGLVLFFVFMGTLWNLIEFNGIYSGKLAMEMALQNIVLDNDDGTRHIKKECF